MPEAALIIQNGVSFSSGPVPVGEVRALQAVLLLGEGVPLLVAQELVQGQQDREEHAGNLRFSCARVIPGKQLFHESRYVFLP